MASTLSYQPLALEVSAHTNGYSNDSDCKFLTDFPGVDLYEEDILTQLQGVLNRMDEIYSDWEKKEHGNE